ncbi:MAG: hypothetical protein HGB12_05340 [Bacteroidetes bacterium]|nr:hypothetical protein [Bacteroidota bacterium]
MTDLKIVDRLERTDNYITKKWKAEKAFRYVIEFNDHKFVESSAFIHYDNSDKILDLTIEISTMYGCPLRCKFCDTNKINSVKYLNSNEIVLQVQKTLMESNLNPLDFIDFRISYLAIGENSLIPDEIIESSQLLKKLFSHVLFNLSTVAADISAINKWSNAHLALRTLQISILHYDIVEIKKIIPNIKKFEIDKLINCLISFNKENPNTKIRFNYVLIENYNDSIGYLNKLVEILKPLKSIVYFRISILNETEGTKQYYLNQVTKEKTELIVKTLIENDYNAYIFGTFINQRISCGQFIGKYDKYCK